MIKCFRKLDASKAEYDLAVYEDTYAYHTVFHNHNFRSLDSLTTLQKNLQTRNFPVQEQSANKSLPTFMLLGLLNN
jgi:hypothetical protein